MKNNRRWSIRIWDDREYLDLWHVNHFLAGFLLSSCGILLQFNFWIIFSLSFFLMIGWEYFEVKNDIEETAFNMTADVVLGLAGYFLVYLFDFSFGLMLATFIIVFIVWITLELWGYHAYKIRGGNKKWRKKI